MLYWVVTVTQVGDKFDFPIGYFPRKFKYKTDAIQCVEEVKRKGGAAAINRPTSTGKDYMGNKFKPFL